MHDTQIALVTGASRGIGAEVARQLAHPGTHVVVNDRDKANRAHAVVDAIRAAGGHASAVVADIADDAAATSMIAGIRLRFGRLDTLVLNASGGLDLDTDASAAMRVNRDAQRRLVELALPLMPTGARVVYVTSHQAHFYPHKAVPKGYAPIAASMRAGETAMYGMRNEFQRRGIHFTVVSGDMTNGVRIAPTPSADGFAAAIAGATQSRFHPGIVYVGGSPALSTA
ncbi:SDR family oxidoreductase [Mycobacterium sp. NPDC003323]